MASYEALLSFLTAAASQDAAASKRASDELPVWQKVSGFYNELHKIAADRGGQPLELRMAAILLFKNGAVGVWRNSNSSILIQEHKAEIRPRMLTFFDDPTEAIAVANAVAFAKVARNDFPRFWPTLLDDLGSVIAGALEGAKAGDERARLVLQRSLHALHLVTKEIASIKIMTRALSMATLIPKMFPLMLEIYTTSFAAWTSALDPSTVAQPPLLEWILASLYSLKCLAKMCTYDWGRVKDTDFERACGLFQLALTHLSQLHALRSSLLVALPSPPPAGSDKTLHALTRLINAYGRFFKQLQASSPPKFSEIPGVEALVHVLWERVKGAGENVQGLVSTSDNAIYPTKSLVQAFTILKICLADWAPPAEIDSSRPATQPTTAQLSDDFAEEVVTFIVERYLPLSATDLQEWAADPEEWLNAEEADQWEIEMRPCAERVVLGALIKRRHRLGPVLSRLLDSVRAAALDNLQSVLLKEAVYRAAGRCAEYLHADVNFETWLAESLTAEVQAPEEQFRILRRRVASVLGKFVAESRTPAAYTHIYTILLHCLRSTDPASDIAVRLTAAQALREAVDTWEFDPVLFEPFLGDVMPELVKLLGEAELMENKLRVNAALTLIIERMGDKVVPYAQRVIDLIPGLWENAGEEWLFKSSLLTTVTKLVEALQEGSNRVLHLVVPLIRHGLDPGQAKTFLDGDTIILWQTALRHAPALDASLVELFPLAVSTLQNDFELLSQTLSIIESYVYLTGEQIMQLGAQELFTAFNSLIAQSHAWTIEPILQTLCIILHASSSASWAPALASSGLFRRLLEIFLTDKESPVLLTRYIITFARILLSSAAAFVQLVQHTAAEVGQPEDVLLDGILDQWWKKWDNFSSDRDRKASALGLACLVGLGSEVVLRRLPGEIATVFLDVLGEVRETQDAETGELHAHWKTEGASDGPSPSPSSLARNADDEGTAERTRRLALYATDPVATIPLTQFISHKLAEAQAAVGGAEAFNARYFAAADPAVVKQLIEYIS